MDMTTFLLCAFAFFAGLVDAVAGGGGLIQLPGLLILRPDLSVVTLLGTNKFSSIFGTSAAIVRYSRSMSMNTKLMIPFAVTAFVASALGASFAHQLDSEVLRPLVIGLLVCIFLYTVFRPSFREISEAPPTWAQVGGIAAGAILGFYDGFFGPGTGGFLIFVCIQFFGMSALQASASAKLVNWATNLAALIYFVSIQAIAFEIAIPMALSNLAGGWMGSSLAIKRGAKFIRLLFTLVVAATLLKLIYDQWLAV
jgi:uncharacterized membrane protein YfcA